MCRFHLRLVNLGTQNLGLQDSLICLPKQICGPSFTFQRFKGPGKGPQMGDLRKGTTHMIVFESKMPFVRVTLQLDDTENVKVFFFDYVKNQEVLMYDGIFKPDWPALERCHADAEEFKKLVNSDPVLRLKVLGWLVVEGMDIVHAVAGREIDNPLRKISGQPSKL